MGGGKGMAAGERGEIEEGEWLVGFRKKGFRVWLREIGEATMFVSKMPGMT